MSEEIKKITEEELSKIKDFQNKIAKTLQDVGVLEAEKHALLHMVSGLNQDQEKLKKELEEKYGSININLADGTFEEIKKEEKENE